MTLTVALHTIGTLASLGLGFFGLLSPRGVEKLVGIKATETRGVSEIRATYGGVFLGLSSFALYAQESLVFTALGCGWAGACMARLVSILIDRASTKLNFGGVIFEGIIAALLLVR